MKTISFASRVTELKKRPASPGGYTPSSLSCIQDREAFYASLGSALMCSPMFQNNGLNLYSGVPAKYLLPDGAPPLDEYLDFVVCQGQNVVKALKLMGTNEQLLDRTKSKFQSSGLSPDLVQIIQSNSFDFDDVNGFAQELESYIGQYSCDTPHITVPFCPIPSNLLKQLMVPFKKAFVQTEEKDPLLTEFGRSLGILMSFKMYGNNIVHPFFCCPTESLSTLQQAVSWGELPPLPAGKEISLSKRVDIANQGLTFNVSAVMDMVRSLGEISLMEYFEGHEDRLEQFSISADSFQQAALYMDSLSSWKDRSQLYAFIAPLVLKSKIPLVDKPLRSFFYAASLVAKSEYLTWSVDRILRDYGFIGITEKSSLQTCFRLAIKKCKEYEMAQKDQDDINALYQLIYSLIIEPFSLIQQRTNLNVHKGGN